MFRHGNARTGEFRRPALPRFSPAATRIAWICLAVFLIQSVAHRLQFPGGYRFGTLLEMVFGLHWPLLRAGCFWQPITYNFLHGSWLHLFLNMFSLLFFGSAVEWLTGTRRFWLLYLLSGILGGLGWMLFNGLEPHLWLFLGRLPGDFWAPLAQRWAERQPIGAFGVCIGASAAVFGLIGAFAALCPERKLFLLLFFIIPLRLKARTLALLLMAVTLIQLMVGWGEVAYAAHLVGGIVGYLLGRNWRGLVVLPHWSGSSASV
jgi:membrane associated rhomboid family serine protease